MVSQVCTPAATILGVSNFQWYVLKLFYNMGNATGEVETPEGDHE